MHVLRMYFKRTSILHKQTSLISYAFKCLLLKKCSYVYFELIFKKSKDYKHHNRNHHHHHKKQLVSLKVSCNTAVTYSIYILFMLKTTFIK